MGCSLQTFTGDGVKHCACEEAEAYGYEQNVEHETSLLAVIGAIDKRHRIKIRDEIKVADIRIL